MNTDTKDRGEENSIDLVKVGDFILSSGAKSRYIIDCNALSDGAIEGIAYLISRLVGQFGSVEGVPRGGLKIARALEKYAVPPHEDSYPTIRPHLIVDDVLTTGASMERLKAMRTDRVSVLGAVIFSRGPYPFWIKPVFPLPAPLWLTKEEINWDGRKEWEAQKIAKLVGEEK